MQTFQHPKDASHWCQQQRDNGKTIGFVATMGALHDGHLELVQRAKRENDVVCVSIFVNPLQFNNAQDLAKYPRTFSDDCAKLERIHCDMVFSGEIDDFFANELDKTSPLPIAPLACLGLEEEFRPGHFQGVWKIVEQLFITVGNCRAYFGNKDFQQVMLVKELADYLRAQPNAQKPDIDIVACETIRETTGLALSSRNLRLSETQRAQALIIYETLNNTKKLWQQGERHGVVLESYMQKAIAQSELKLEYAAIRDPNQWSATTPSWRLQQAQALIAGYIGDIRLIDNMPLH